ncbi:MAG: ABC transporter permease [Candidatus Dojkabacteria bacterium]
MPKKKKSQRDLFIELVKTNFKLRYNDSLLGILWVALKPFLNFIVLYAIWTTFRKGFDDPNYAANLLIGLVIYMFAQEGTQFGMGALLNLSGIILKVNFPRELAVSSAVTVAFANLVINLVVVLAITLIAGYTPALGGIAYFAFIVLTLFMLIYGASLFISIILVRVRDLDNIIQVGFRLLFWASAIFYDINELEGAVGDLVRINPLAIIIDAARNAVVLGEFTHVKYIFALALFTAVLFVTGQVFFRKNVKRVAEFY